jgi:hypothetical protein
MQGRISAVFIRKRANLPSIDLEEYLGDYAAHLPIIDCAQDHNKQRCDDELIAYRDDERLIFDGRAYKSIGYPAVALFKDSKAYLFRSVSEFEQIVGCGSLNAAE